MSDELQASIPSVIRGFHVYSGTWTPVVGEELTCRRDIRNVHDRYCVAVVNPMNNCVVGHLPKKISIFLSLFLRRGGNLSCRVISNRRQRSVDLPQGGLEIPCLIVIKGQTKLVKKMLKKLSM